MQSLLFCKVLAKKPGWKDSNFQVMNAKFDIVATLASKAAVFGKKSTACVLPALVEKFVDIKVNEYYRHTCGYAYNVHCTCTCTIQRCRGVNYCSSCSHCYTSTCRVLDIPSSALKLSLANNLLNLIPIYINCNSN